MSKRKFKTVVTNARVSQLTPFPESKYITTSEMVLVDVMREDECVILEKERSGAVVVLDLYSVDELGDRNFFVSEKDSDEYRDSFTPCCLIAYNPEQVTREAFDIWLERMEVIANNAVKWLSIHTLQTIDESIKDEYSGEVTTRSYSEYKPNKHNFLSRVVYDPDLDVAIEKYEHDFKRMLLLKQFDKALFKYEQARSYLYNMLDCVVDAVFDNKDAEVYHHVNGTMFEDGTNGVEMGFCDYCGENDTKNCSFCPLVEDKNSAKLEDISKFLRGEW